MQVLNTQKDYKDVANIVIMVYGFGGVGKSTFASTFPKPLFCDFENGVKFFKQRGINADVIKVDKWFTVEDKKELAKVVKDYDTLVFDPIGEMMDKLIHSDSITGSKYRQSDGSLAMAGWGKVKDEFRSVLKWARDLGKHIVLLAHVDERTDEDTLVRRPLIATKIVDEVIAMVDIVGYLDVINVDGVEKRVIRVNPADKKFIAKDRTGALPAYVKPEFAYIHDLIVKNQAVSDKPKTPEAPEAPAETPKDVEPEKPSKKSKGKKAPKEDDVTDEDREANPFNKKSKQIE